MNTRLLKPSPKSMIYEDKILYVCLATYPITKGHIIIAMKKDIHDLHLLSDRDYDYLMDIVRATRNALLKTLKIKKVYLIYMDETKHVHWHLVPRYNVKGYDVFLHKPKNLKEFSLVKKMQKNLVFK